MEIFCGCPRACRRVRVLLLDANLGGGGFVWNDPYKGLGQRRPAPPVEDVAFHARAVLASDGHVAAIVEGLLQRLAQLGFISQLGDRAF